MFLDLNLSGGYVNFSIKVSLEKTWNNFKCEWPIFASVWKWSFTFISTVSKLLTISYSFLNFRLYLLMLQGSAIINMFFTVIKLFSFRKSLIQTDPTAAFPICFTVTDLWSSLTDSIKTFFTLFCNVSFDSLVDGLTRKEMQKRFKLNLVLNIRKIGEHVFVAINFKFIYFQNFLKD